MVPCGCQATPVDAKSSASALSCASSVFMSSNSIFDHISYRGLNHSWAKRLTKSCSCRGTCKEKLCTNCVIALVGLPATGKTYISTKLTHYLNWIGIPTKAFNVGDYRRRTIGQYQSHTFFRSDNEESQAQRKQLAQMAIDDVVKYLEQEGGDIAVLDATNSTRERRKLLVDTFIKTKAFNLFFVESVCTDPDVIDANIREVKICSKDYEFMDKTLAVKDFLQRIEHYKVTYESLDFTRDADISYIQIYNQGERFIVNKMAGILESRIVYYLMNIRVLKRTIYMTRHGESLMNLVSRLGGDSELSENGKKYAVKLAKYIESENIPHLKVWTSCKKRTILTASDIYSHKEYLVALDEIDAGICEGMTREEMRKKYPEEFAAREKDKYHYRYPNGESYSDLVARLEPIIMELERQKNVLVVCHTAILRCLLAYFMDKTPDNDLPYLDVPLHTVFKLTSKPYGCNVERINLDINV